MLSNKTYETYEITVRHLACTGTHTLIRVSLDEEFFTRLRVKWELLEFKRL